MEELKPKYLRAQTRPVKVGDVVIGGGAPISVQSMAKTDTTDVAGVLAQAEAVHRAGGDLFRVSVPDEDSAHALAEIVKNSPIPIIADIHFDYRLALMSLEAGVAKLRINPGNIGSAEKVRIVAREAKSRGVPIRVGVNAGSLPHDLLKKYGAPTPEAMVEAAAREIEILREVDFEDIVISLKSSSPMDTLRANLLFAQKFNYPLHIGVTESGFGYQGIIASTVGLALVLHHGIGDTVRVSLTDPPDFEVRVAREILRDLGLRKYWIRIISCPTCARRRADVSAVARKIWDRIKDIQMDLTVAVMGCEVNGPGEAREADIGVACGQNFSLIFERGEVVERVDNDKIVDAILRRITSYKKPKNF